MTALPCGIDVTTAHYMIMHRFISHELSISRLHAQAARFLITDNIINLGYTSLINAENEIERCRQTNIEYKKDKRSTRVGKVKSYNFSQTRNDSSTPQYRKYGKN